MRHDEVMSPKRRRGRPSSVSAVSHERILDAVEEILREKSVRDLTIEEVARRAGVGKPTIYKWWSSKAALVLDLFEERMVDTLAVPHAVTAEEAIRGQVTELIRLLNGFFGKVARELIAEGQSDPDVLREYRDRYLSKRRAFSYSVIEKAKTTGEIRGDADAALLVDRIYGPIYYRLLLQHEPLDAAFGNALVDDVLASVR
ncbi:MAG: TetR/AcrR family transcriptional regulator [Armatimonadota bacterium]